MEEPSQSSSSTVPLPNGSEPKLTPSKGVDDDFVSGMVTTIELRRSQLPIVTEQARLPEEVADSEEGPLTEEVADSVEGSLPEEFADADARSRQKTEDYIDLNNTGSEVQTQPWSSNGVVQIRPATGKPTKSNSGRPVSSAMQAAKAAEDATQMAPRDDARRLGPTANVTSDSQSPSRPTTETASEKWREPKPVLAERKRHSKAATFFQAAGYAVVTFLALVGIAALGYVLAASDILG